MQFRLGMVRWTQFKLNWMAKGPVNISFECIQPVIIGQLRFAVIRGSYIQDILEDLCVCSG
jgi:hypothetical protein